jgi:hypothetical protein
MSINPANLRWKYLLESLIDEELGGETEKAKWHLCIQSLTKFPLVISSFLLIN